MRRGSEGVGSERDEGLVRRGMSLSLFALVYTIKGAICTKRCSSALYLLKDTKKKNGN